MMSLCPKIGQRVRRRLRIEDLCLNGRLLASECELLMRYCECVNLICPTSVWGARNPRRSSRRMRDVCRMEHKAIAPDGATH